MKKAIPFISIILALGACCPKKVDHSKSKSRVSVYNIFDTLSHHMNVYTYGGTDTLNHAPEGEQPDSLLAELLIDPSTYIDAAESQYYSERLQQPQTQVYIQKAQAMQALQPLAQRLGLPLDAKIVEVRDLSKSGIKNRKIVLWMEQPKAHLDITPEYTCPEYAHGKAYLSGKAYVSLVNAQDSLMNTVKIRSAMHVLSTDTLKMSKIKTTVHLYPVSLPLSSLKKLKGYGTMGGLYHADNATDSSDGPAQILYLKDYNLDGKALEFAIYENTSCASTLSSLYGYSPRQDRIIAFPLEYHVTHEAPQHQVEEHVGSFIERLFLQTPSKYPITFSMDYRGRGGMIEHYKVDYDKDCETFEVTLRYQETPENDDLGAPWIPEAVFE
ncbi:MAG TPA: hypothetical protein VL947_09150 [Cytophagales bacterium]|nr:hypothetical protein [Cytophagales bacterium]